MNSKFSAILGKYNHVSLDLINYLKRSNEWDKILKDFGEVTVCLTCHDTRKNHDKFYLVTFFDGKHRAIARAGRSGTWGREYTYNNIDAMDKIQKKLYPSGDKTPYKYDTGTLNLPKFHDEVANYDFSKIAPPERQGPFAEIVVLVRDEGAMWGISDTGDKLIQFTEEGAIKFADDYDLEVKQSLMMI